MVTAQKEVDRLKDIIGRLEASNERRQKKLNDALTQKADLAKAVEERDVFIEDRKVALATAEQKIRELEEVLVQLKDQDQSQSQSHSLARITCLLTSNNASLFRF